MARSNPSHTSKLSLEQLLEAALSSSDAIFIRQAINRIEESTAAKEERERVVDLVAKKHAEKTIVVTRCLSALARSQAPQLRPLCRTLINAPFDPDHEDVVAYAATLLASIPHPERVDMLLLAKGVDHRSTAVKSASRKAVESLPKELRAPLLALAREAPEKAPITLLIRHLTGSDWRDALALPRPHPSDRESLQRPQREP